MNIDVDRLTEFKAQSIAERGFAITGVVLTDPSGAKCIVDLSAVRWLSNDEFWDLMHPDSVRNGGVTR